ncbi:MAG TPA: AcvB/VirJ family lysyl-phosphatidylglycerol hydrolase [Steroidobacteraceae bacterium]|nr:AcvB/VirJ family lysyl-phosphatidylglycerol hydrolase [Steroidobacteraceae bacterium]
MTRALLLSVAFFLAALTPTCYAAPGTKPPGDSLTEEHIVHGDFGDVVITRLDGTPTSVVLFVSGDGGWNRGVKDMARALVERGAMVVGIDVRTYIANVNKGGEKCRSLAGDFEELAHHVEKRLGMPHYLVPALTGYSSGATLVYAVLAQAPKGTFTGAVSLGFCPDLPLRTELCRGDGLEYTLDAKGRNSFFKPSKTLGAPLIALHGEMDAVCQFAKTGEFVAATPRGELVSLPKVGHGYGVPARWQPQFLEALVKLADAPTGAAMTSSSGKAVAAVADLPLVEVPVPPTIQAHPSAFAVILTGDGGWAGLDQDVGSLLAARGIPVVGLSSLKYFWQQRTADEAAHDLQRIIQHYTAAWRKSEVILIGYSFGADVLPSLVNRLSAASVARIKSLNLLGLSDTVAFEVHVAGWIPGVADRGAPIRPELDRLPKLPVLCVYGSTEASSECPRVEQRPNWRNLELQGGHHFGGQFTRLGEEVARFAGV